MSRTMLVVFATILCAFALLEARATADSIQLRDGRHLQGKYMGGTTTSIGFMTDRAIEYFPTSQVLVLIFESSAVEYRPSSFTSRVARKKLNSTNPRGAMLRRIRQSAP